MSLKYTDYKFKSVVNVLLEIETNYIKYMPDFKGAK